MPYVLAPSPPVFSGHPYAGQLSTPAGTLTQVAHGFTLGQVLYHDGSQFQLAQSNNLDTLGYYLVAQVIDADSFRLAFDGEVIEGLTGLTPGGWYSVSAVTPGGLVTTDNAAAPVGGVAQNVIGQAISPTTLIFKSFKPVEI